MSWTPKRSLVVPIDFSEESFAAAELATEFVDSPEAIHLVHILPDLSPMEPGVIWKTVDDESRCKHAQDALKERAAKSKAAGASVFIGFGDPAREIVSYAEAQKADLIVIPSQGKGGALRALIGSVADKVVRLAHCEVLLLPK